MALDINRFDMIARKNTFSNYDNREAPLKHSAVFHLVLNPALADKNSDGECRF